MFYRTDFPKLKMPFRRHGSHVAFCVTPQNFDSICAITQTAAMLFVINTNSVNFADFKVGDGQENTRQRKGQNQTISMTELHCSWGGGGVLWKQLLSIFGGDYTHLLVYISCTNCSKGMFRGNFSLLSSSKTFITKTLQFRGGWVPAQKLTVAQLVCELSLIYVNETFKMILPLNFVLLCRDPFCILMCLRSILLFPHPTPPHPSRPNLPRTLFHSTLNNRNSRNMVLLQKTAVTQPLTQDLLHAFFLLCSNLHCRDYNSQFP
jgi:hypothetical protein